MTGHRPVNWSSLEEFRAFANRPEVRRVTEKYADWMRSSEGIDVAMRIMACAITVPAKRFDTRKLKRSVCLVSAFCAIPFEELAIVAESLIRTWYTMASGNDRPLPAEGEADDD